MKTVFSLFGKLLAAVAIVAVALGARPVQPALAATITVNIASDDIVDDANCSLREAIVAANTNASFSGCTYSGAGPNDTITLTSGVTYILSRVGSTETTGDLDIGNAAGTSGNLIIQASGAANAIIDAADISRVLEVGAAGNPSLTLIRITVTNGTDPDGGGIYFGGTGTLTLMNSTVSNNVATGSANCGAGIYNNTAANLVITDSTVQGNTCTGLGADGAGLYKGTGGMLTVTNSTFANNTTTDAGGGARLNMISGQSTIRNSTFFGNVAGTRGGGLQVDSGSVSVEFSTFSHNQANDPMSASAGGAIQASGGSISVVRSILANSIRNSGSGQDCDQLSPGTVSITNSLVESNSDCTGSITSTADPGLGALANNGGPTSTMAITSASPAHNAALSCGSVTTDQRGVTRPQDAACDLGAFELEEVVDPGPTFADVPEGYWAFSFIERLYGAGITGGCATTPLQYCPENTVTRAEMAVFLLRGIHGSNYSPPAVGSSTGFSDVPPTHWAAAWIKQLAAEGITGGCGTNAYCPEAPVTRAQMAVFLLRSKHGASYSPPAVGSSTGFSDVPTTYWAAAWIKQLVVEGITSGCGANTYCPESPVTRAEMAVFLVRTFNLP